MKRGVVVTGLALSALIGTTRVVEAQTMDRARYLFVLVEELEYAPGFEVAPVLFEADAWYGGDFNRLWVKTEGEIPTDGGEEEVEIQALYSRLVAPYWDFQIGVRVDRTFSGGDDTRAYFVVGLEGLAPYWFEVEPALFLSDQGDLSARFEAAYELLFTQRLIAEPELEVGAAFQDVAEDGVESGLTDLDLGVRFRYEIRREVAPYVGFGWKRLLGDTGDRARARGDRRGDASVLLGIRVWY